MVVEIFSWLPPKSLIRFKIVQKSWYVFIDALIKNPAFVAKHLSNSKKTLTPSLFFKSVISGRDRINQGVLTICNGKDRWNKYYKCVIDNFGPLSVPRYMEDTEDILFTKNYFLAGSHCDGITCLSLKRSVVLCNLETKEIMPLPDPCFKDKLFHYEDKLISKVGFGHDPVANVYKVVKVSAFYDDIRAQVYTLGINDSWREIEVQIETIYTKKELNCKGFYYWLAINDAYLEEAIHSFDMHDEKFHYIPLPYNQSAEWIKDWHIELTEWNESVALFYYPRANSTTTKPIQVWVMHDQSYESPKTNQCWTKYLSINPLGLYKIPIAFWKSDELLMREGESNLVSYNILTKRVRILQRKFHMGEIDWFRAFRYVKSLVSLDKMNNLGKHI